MHKDNQRGASESLNTGRQSYTLFFCSVIHKEVAYELLRHLGVLLSLFISGGRPMNGSLRTARGWGRAPPGALPAPQNQLCSPRALRAQAGAGSDTTAIRGRCRKTFKQQDCKNPEVTRNESVRQRKDEE